MKTKLLKNEEDILFTLEHLHCFYFYLGHDVRLKQFQVGQTLITVGHCPMTNAYIQPLVDMLESRFDFGTLDEVIKN